MTRQDAINHTKFYNGDAGLISSHHAAGYIIRRTGAEVRTWSGCIEPSITAEHNGKHIAISETPADGWDW